MSPETDLLLRSVLKGLIVGYSIVVVLLVGAAIFLGGRWLFETWRDRVLLNRHRQKVSAQDPADDDLGDRIIRAQERFRL